MNQNNMTQERKAELFDRALEYVQEVYDDAEIYEVLHESFGMSNEEIEAATWLDLQKYLKEENISILKVEPGATPKRETIPNELKAMQEAVGGLIETVGLGDGVILICNEEGKLTGLEPNRRIGDDIIAGTFLLVSENACGDFASLSEEQCKLCEERFAEPEQFDEQDIVKACIMKFF